MPNYFHNADLQYLTIYPYDVIVNVFNQILNDTNIEFNYPQGGCQQRAQIMSMLLKKKFQIDHCKVWLFAPVVLEENQYQTLYINDVDDLTNQDEIQWNYHVAPVVQVEKDGNISTMVIDPSIVKNEPVFLSTWFYAIGNSEVSKYTFMLPDKYFFNCVYNNTNELTTIFDGSFYNYEEDDKNDLTLEKGLALNDVAIAVFNKHIKLHASASTKQIYDLKEIFGNATAMDFLFAQNLSGKTDETKLRYVLTNYTHIFTEARDLFSKRVVYWTSITNALI